MKKGLTGLLPVACLTLLLAAGCKGSQNGGQTGENDTTVVSVPDTALYGHLGEGTGMSCLELITDSQDTLVLNKTDEQTGEDGLILGEIANYTDRFSVVTDRDTLNIRIALNIDMLTERLWQSTADSRRGFCLKSDGAVETPAGQTDAYRRWTLCNCQLLLHDGDADAAGRTDRCDTMDILSLTRDSLTLRNIHSAQPESFQRIR